LALSDEEIAAFDSHHRSADYAESAATWLAMGRDAGLRRAEQLICRAKPTGAGYRYGV
jgi:hypothetical protein